MAESDRDRCSVRLVVDAIELPAHTRLWTGSGIQTAGRVTEILIAPASTLV